MALAQFVQEPLNIRITKRMFAPKRKLQDPMQWYKDARKLIKELPELMPAPDIHLLQHQPELTKDHWWLANTPDISVRYLKFTLTNGIGERAHLVIDRIAPSLGT